MQFPNKISHVNRFAWKLRRDDTYSSVNPHRGCRCLRALAMSDRLAICRKTFRSVATFGRIVTTGEPGRRLPIYAKSDRSAATPPETPISCKRWQSATTFLHLGIARSPFPLCESLHRLSIVSETSRCTRFETALE